ncbi:MAG: hypothetical protein AB1941_01815 [Gemmatimonadota bacterium]
MNRLIPAVFALCLLSACSPIAEVEVRSGPTAETTLPRDHRLSNGVVLPAGTVVSDATDVTGRPYVHFRLPEGYRLVSAAAGAESGGMLEEEGGITCTCTEGTGGCSPFKADGPAGTVIGCSMKDGCTKCEQAVSALDRTVGGVRLLSGRETDILHLAAGISFVVGPEELEALSCPGKAAFAWDGFGQGIAEFLAGVQMADRSALRAATTREQLPASYTMMFVNAYGKTLRVPVQRGTTLSEWVAGVFFALPRPGSAQPGAASADETSGGVVEEDGKTTCKCLSGSSGCTYQRKSAPLIGYAEWCDAKECGSCQMNWDQVS